MRTKLIALLNAFACASLFSLPAGANTVTRVAPSAQTAEPNKPFSLTFSFAENQGPVSCGLSVDWGDGKVERLRVGEGQQLTPPYTLEHTYANSGDYKIRIAGEAIVRGLRSVLPCDVKRETSLSVMDAAEAAKLAEAKAAEEREKRARDEAAAQARKEQAERAAAAAQAQAQAQANRPAAPRPQSTQAAGGQQKYVPDPSKKYVGVVSCEKDPSTPDTYNILKQALRIYASGNTTAFTGFMGEMRKWCKVMNTPAQPDKLGNVVLEFESGGRHFLSLAVSNGFQNFRQGNSSVMLPTWTMYGIVSD